MSCTTQIDERELRLRFERPWTTDDYTQFLRSKRLPEMILDYSRQDDSYTLRAPARFAASLGLQSGPGTAADMPLAGFLFPYQGWITQMALEAKRFAVWSDCGTGKTPIQLEWARHVMHRTGGKVLIFAPLAVCHQTTEEARKFYPDGEVQPYFQPTRGSLIEWLKDVSGPRLGITNYHKIIDGQIRELKWLGGIILDESSILKGGGGVIKWNLIKSCKGIEYKLSLTATPAPNDTMEYASQASFLEKLRSDGEIIWTYFYRDQKTQVWSVKPHAREAFYRFMASWSIYLRKPSAYGFADPFADVPEPQINEVKVLPTEEQSRRALEYLRSYDPGSLIPQDRLGVRERSKLSQIAKGFLYGPQKSVERIPSRKPGIVAESAKRFVNDGHQVLIWTVFDEESEIVAEHLSRLLGVATLHGKHSEDERTRILDAFRHGEVRCLISKAKLLGHGLNFQFCTRMIFSGFDDSFEAFYQAVRRCYRYGSREQLQVFVPYIPSLENHIWENVLRKKGRWEEDASIQERHYAEALSRELLQ